MAKPSASHQNSHISRGRLPDVADRRAELSSSQRQPPSSDATIHGPDDDPDRHARPLSKRPRLEPRSPSRDEEDEEEEYVRKGKTDDAE